VNGKKSKNQRRSKINVGKKVQLAVSASVHKKAFKDKKRRRGNKKKNRRGLCLLGESKRVQTKGPVFPKGVRRFGSVFNRYHANTIARFAVFVN
jgi:hypothetical protein